MTPKSPWNTTKEKNDFKAGSQESKSRAPVRDPFGYAQAQEDEVEVLKAIYMDDYEEVEVKNAWSVSWPILRRVFSYRRLSRASLLLTTSTRTMSPGTQPYYARHEGDLSSLTY